MKEYKIDLIDNIIKISIEKKKLVPEEKLIKVLNS